MAIITVYDLLEVSEDASKEEIEKSYLYLINEYKTDPRNPQEVNNENEMILKKMKLAYDILIDDEKRKKYDAELARKRAEELIKNVTVSSSDSEEIDKKVEENIPENEISNVEQIQHDEIEKYEEDDDYEDDTTKIELTDNEKKKLKKAAEKEFKNNLKKVQKAEEEYNRAYNEAYNNYLRKMGYTVKEPWTLKRLKNLIIGLFVIIVVCILIWILPPTKNLLIRIYEENFIIKSLIDIIVMVFNAIINTFV
ncbi:MAG: DnaJ domain-containing protein [Clostridia bacterium]|nr:DnaJ domain-containing protein [Clostridia bacterium]